MTRLIQCTVILVFLSITSSLAYDNGQFYSRIRIYEYDDYSSVKFVQFNIEGPTPIARWSLIFSSNEQCSRKAVHYHFHLQYGAYPLINLRNESFPENYISTRHDLSSSQFNQTVPNGTVLLNNPRQGRWFAATFVEEASNAGTNPNSLKSCTFFLTATLDYQAIAIPLTLIFNQPSLIHLPNRTSSMDASYSTSIGQFHLNALLDFTPRCDIHLFIRLNGLADRSQYDSHIVCPNGACTLDLGRFAAFLSVYFHITVDPISCATYPISGTILIRPIDCDSTSPSSCFPLDPMRRMIFNSYYDFIYVPSSTMNTSLSILLNNRNQSSYVYEFVVDDRNLGGTIHIDFQSQMLISNANVDVRVCFAKYRPETYETCAEEFQVLIPRNNSVTRSLPYPEMALWYLTLEFHCNDSDIQCDNALISVLSQVSSTACTRDSCGNYGVCRLLTTQQNIYSTCTCIAGYRGYGCTDSSKSYVWKYLPSVLFLTLSNLLFIPAIALAIYSRLYIEALIYFFNMFFSTFYHACDQELFNFCIFKYDGLQLADFIGSYASFVITLLTMALIPRIQKAFLFMFGVLACVAINARDRFGTVQFIVLLSITFALTLATWIYNSVKKRQLHPSWKTLLCFTPGFILAITGLILFVLVETDENYWYIHSLWHIFISISILFFLPRRKKTNIDSATPPPLGFVNPAANFDLQSENPHL